MVLVYFASGRCVDAVVNNRTNYQITSAIIVNFMNSARVFWIIKVFNVYFCLNHRHQRQFLHNLDNFYI